MMRSCSFFLMNKQKGEKGRIGSIKVFTVVGAMFASANVRHCIRPEGSFGRMERRKSFVRRIGEQDGSRYTMLMLTKRGRGNGRFAASFIVRDRQTKRCRRTTERISYVTISPFLAKS